jgi:hypothetical protein
VPENEDLATFALTRGSAITIATNKRHGRLQPLQKSAGWAPGAMLAHSFASTIRNKVIIDTGTAASGGNGHSSA